MVRLASLIPVAAMLIASPALAREERTNIDVPSLRLDQAVRMLGRQTGASIGFRDTRVSKLRGVAVRGKLTTGEALVLMLRGSGARARRVASDTFLVEIDPEPARDRAPPRASPPPSRLAAPEAAVPPPIEIVVTGTKRDIPIESYPGLVHILAGERISPASGRLGSEAIEAAAASVVSTHLGPGRNKLFIRGIADSSFVGPTQATVGQYWGNSRITYSAPDPSLKLYDLRRIEVLEGPQGTLYGAGSLGGIVRVVPREPMLDRVEGSVWAGVEAVQHGEPGFDLGAVLNVPLVEDRLGLRLGAFGTVENGYIDDVERGLDNVNDVDSIGGRVSLRYEGESGWTVDLSAVGQRIDGKDSQYAEIGLGALKRSSAIAQPYRNDFLLADVVMRKDWDAIEFTSSLGFAYQDVFEEFEGPALASVEDSSRLPPADAPIARYSQANRVHMLTGELRLAKSGEDGTGWLIAASFLQNEGRVNRRMDLATLGSPLTGVRNKVREATVYGETTFALGGRFALTAGGRLTHSRLSGGAEDAVRPQFIFALDPGARASRSETRFLPSLALAYRASDATTLFARYQEGFRPGGIAVRREFVQRYRGDRVRTVEAGVRHRGDGLELEASASWTDWRDIQADLIDGFGFPTTANVGDGRVFSLGFSGRWRPVPALELDAAAYANWSKVTERDHILEALQPAGSEESFDRLPNIADMTARLGFTWWMPLDSDHDLELSGFGRYVGKSILGVGPVLGQLQGDYVDTGIEANLRTGRLQYSLSMTNLFDARGNRFALGSPFQIRDRDQITPLKPRSVRFGIRFDF